MPYARRHRPQHSARQQRGASPRASPSPTFASSAQSRRPLRPRLRWRRLRSQWLTTTRPGSLTRRSASSRFLGSRSMVKAGRRLLDQQRLTSSPLQGQWASHRRWSRCERRLARFCQSATMCTTTIISRRVAVPPPPCRARPAPQRVRRSLVPTRPLRSLCSAARPSRMLGALRVPRIFSSCFRARSSARTPLSLYESRPIHDHNYKAICRISYPHAGVPHALWTLRISAVDLVHTQLLCMNAARGVSGEGVEGKFEPVAPGWTWQSTWRRARLTSSESDS